jgi:RNA polymerase sigma-70 factor (ECF subfamily)
MHDADPVVALVARARTGDHNATEQLFGLYVERLTRLAEEHLSRRLAGRVDSEDVVQSVFRTFFRRCAAGQFSIDTSRNLYRLLVTITLRKTAAKARRHTSGSRDVLTEAPAAADGALLDAIARDPDPSAAAELLDEIEILLRGLPSLHAQVLDLRLQGYAVAEIAPRLGVSRQTIYRALEVLQQRLVARAGEGV